MCRARFFVVDMVSDLKRKVISILDQVFPEYEKLFSDIFGLTSSELLHTCSTPEEILAIDTDKLADLIETRSNKRYGIEKAIEIKQVAENSFGILIGIDSMSLLIKQYIEHIRFSENQIKEIDNRIAEMFSEFDTYITTIPGIGPVLGATIFTEIGDISRFSSPAKLAAFASALDEAVKSLLLNKEKSIIVKSKENTIRLGLDSIMYVQLLRRRISYYVSNGETIESTHLRTTFSEAIQELLHDSRFFLSGKSMAVNLQHISKIGTDEIVFKNNNKIFLNNKMCRELRSVWSDYWFDKGGLK